MMKTSVASFLKSGTADQPDSARLHEYIERPHPKSTPITKFSKKAPNQHPKHSAISPQLYREIHPVPPYWERSSFREPGILKGSTKNLLSSRILRNYVES
jgi:hypothetical protein